MPYSDPKIRRQYANSYYIDGGRIWWKCKMPEDADDTDWLDGDEFED